MTGRDAAEPAFSPGREPRFSILLPTHNRADVLPFAIRSALWQTDPDFELLIVGDGCTDATASVVAGFSDPRIRWFELPKAPGIGYANRNAALREARGRHVAYLAHDDIWFPDHLVRLGALLDATGADLAYSRGLAVDLDGRVMPYWYNLGVPSHRATLWRGQSAITMCSVVHRRSCVDRYGYWKETLLRSGDIEFWHRIAAARAFANVAFLPEPTALHFVANWRATSGYRWRSRVSAALAGRFLDARLPPALRLPTAGAGTQQASAWNVIAADPEARIRDIRAGVAQLQDALLWPSRSPAGLLGIRVGLAAGAALNTLAQGLLWAASANRRAMFSTLRRHTGARENEAAETGRGRRATEQRSKR